MSKAIIEIDAKSWVTILDIYDDILKHVDAPKWHGRSVNALIDSLVYGGINGREPPYVLRFLNTEQLPGDVAEELILLKQFIQDAQLERKATTGAAVDIGFELM